MSFFRHVVKKCLEISHQKTLLVEDFFSFQKGVNVKIKLLSEVFYGKQL